MKRSAKERREENLITKTTGWVMDILSHYVREGDAVIDATMGNGHDTVSLARLVGAEGRVFAFDVQEQALANTETLLRNIDEQEKSVGGTEGDSDGVKKVGGEGLRRRVRLILDSNVNLRRYVEQSADGPRAVAAALFNLGYLPGGDKSITTTGEETLRAVSEALEMVKPDGLVAIVLYSGHQQGAEEKELLLQWAGRLPAKEYHVAYISMWNQKKHPPELLLVTKKMARC